MAEFGDWLRNIKKRIANGETPGVVSSGNWLVDWVRRVFGLDGTIITGLSDKYLGTTINSDRQATTAFERQQTLDQQNRAWQEQMLDKQNLYNDPANQMQRLRSAGLNVGLAYGQPISESAGVGSGSGSSAPMASAGGVGSITDLISLPHQMKLMDAQAEQMKAQARWTAEQQRDLQLTRQARIEQLWSVIDRNKAEVEDVVSKIQQRVHQNALTDAERENISFEQMFKRNQIAIDWQRVKNETDLTQEQINKLKADTRKALADAHVSEREYQEMVWTFAIRKAGLEKQNTLTDAQIAQANATAKKLGIEANRIQQVIDINRPSEIRSKDLADGSDSLFGQLMLGVDYLLDKVGGAIIPK